MYRGASASGAPCCPTARGIYMDNNLKKNYCKYLDQNEFLIEPFEIFWEKMSYKYITQINRPDKIEIVDWSELPKIENGPLRVCRQGKKPIFKRTCKTKCPFCEKLISEIFTDELNVLKYHLLRNHPHSFDWRETRNVCPFDQLDREYIKNIHYYRLF